MKRNLTAEQIEKRDARRQQFRQLWKQVAAMPELERVNLANKLGIVTVEGHELSLGNTMLVALQNPTASVVGGFRQWIKQGRAVMKGQHGIMIWVPIGHKQDQDSTPAPAEPTGESEPSETRFIIGTVFDISQTMEVQNSQACNEAITEQCGNLQPA